MHLFFFCDARTQLAPRLLVVEVFRLHTHPVGLLCTSDQLVAEAATYITHNKHKRRTSMLPTVFETAIPAFRRLHADAFDLAVAGIDRSTRTFFFSFSASPTRTRAASSLMILDHTQWHTTVGRIPLNEGSVRRRDLYLTKHTIFTERQASMPPPGFELAIWAICRSLTLVLDRSATGMGDLRL